MPRIEMSHSELPSHERLAGIAAALILVIGMGFGRFAFTGLYPLMVKSGQISVEGGSYAASANYAGYLIGALLLGLVTGAAGRKLCAFSAIATVASLAALGLPLPEWLIVAVRGFAGIFSAVAMVAASHWLIHERGHHDGAPALFAGVGLGILVSAELVAAGDVLGLQSPAIWLVLAAAALALTVLTIILQARVDSAPAPTLPHEVDGEASVPFGAGRLVLVYGLAGFGYIITATYLPLLVRTSFADLNPLHIWAVFGLGAVPSCFFWHALHRRLGTAKSLVANLLVQAVGVGLPVIHMPAASLASALLVGGTFMGTVTIAMPAARKIAAKARVNILAVMTASYGVGQIVGPLVTNALYRQSQSFDTSLLIASAALFIAALICMRRATPRTATVFNADRA
ncbi:YbfB/YjiJ family MFS transporter [Afifella sp. JA880]|uniref:YbfB/YjiJ family MFS transporter n=1 Tax=Afifella sp. JA880 TaxID=2975280 RepID=UPI0021BB3C64|nr:YbfB/YjiJ family MFS transporter [Afifella sp. JA880]MCT8268193.1 YbfB/YjiJ family MFS transporter [Afifella sp. JA880]